MPSLHFAWSLWCCVVLVRYSAHRWTRIAGIAYPLLTLSAIVITANHYFLDAVGGAITFGVAIGVLSWRERRSRRRAVDGAKPAPAIEDALPMKRGDDDDEDHNASHPAK
jgi:hypothetical protein